MVACCEPVKRTKVASLYYFWGVCAVLVLAIRGGHRWASREFAMQIFLPRIIIELIGVFWGRGPLLCGADRRCISPCNG